VWRRIIAAISDGENVEALFIDSTVWYGHTTRGGRMAAILLRSNLTA
jgi:hypothetical protein